MRKKIVVVGGEDMSLGFSLAGVDESYVPKNDYEAKKTMERLAGSSDVGVVILSERIAEDIREELEKISQDKDLYPVIIEISDKEGPLEEKEDPLKSKIRRAVGIDITSEERS